MESATQVRAIFKFDDGVWALRPVDLLKKCEIPSSPVFNNYLWKFESVHRLGVSYKPIRGTGGVYTPTGGVE